MNLLRSLLLLLTCASAFGQGQVVNPYRFAAASVGGTSVDLLFQWTGTQGLLTTNIVVASEIGVDKGVIQYMQPHPDLQHTVLTNESYSFPAVNVGGLIYSNNTKSILFDLDAADLGRSPVYEGFSWIPSGSYSNLSVWFGINYNAGGTWNNDSVNIAGGTYAVMENIITLASGYLNAHGQLGTNTTKMGVTDRLINNHEYRVTLRFNAMAQKAEVMVIDAVDNHLVGSGYTNSDLGTVASMQIQDYLLPQSGVPGNIRWRQVALGMGANAVIPMEPAPLVLPITNLIVTLIATNEVDVSWERLAYTDSFLEKNDGTNWSIIQTNLDTSYSDTVNLVVGATNTYRITSLGHNFPYLHSVTVTS